MHAVTPDHLLEDIHETHLQPRPQLETQLTCLLHPLCLEELSRSDKLMKAVCQRGRRACRETAGSKSTPTGKRRKMTSRKMWRAVWKILLRRVISADVHYALARVKKTAAHSFIICLWKLEKRVRNQTKARGGKRGRS